MMLHLMIGTAWRAFAVCLAGIAISGAALALDGALDVLSSPAGAARPADAAEPPRLPSMATVIAAANSSPGISVTPTPNAAPVPPPPGATAPSPLLTQAQLAQLVAPIALDPDPLLAQILMASTYPLEVVEAERWVNLNGNRALKGDALSAALQAQDWDPSVKALVPFPRVLQTMSDQLQWTQELGNAFLAQQVDLMAAVQSLRQEAVAAGNLKQTPRCRCVIHSSGATISILPAEPQVVCVPVYTPAVYGAWPYPAYPPYYFPVPVGFALSRGSWIGFTPPVELAVFGPFWGWGWIDWGHRWIAVDRGRLALVSGGHVWFSGNVWVHDPIHRGGVAYADAATRGRFDEARIAALDSAARSGAARSVAGGSAANNRRPESLGAAARRGIVPSHGEAASRGASGVRHGMALGGGNARFHGAAALRGASGFHNGMAFHGGVGFRAAPAAHGGSATHGGSTGFHAGPASHGGGPHFAAPHFAMSGPRGGGPGGGPHGGGGPHEGGGAGGHHG